MASEIKPIYGNERVKLADVVPLDTPFSMFVFPTTFCNFKCNYCGYSLGYENMKEKYDFTPGNMTMETFEKVVKQIKKFPKKLKMLALTGQGEPLLNKNLPLMVKMAKEADIAERIEIITNASLLTKEMADGLIDAGLDTLRISMQGLSKEKYKEVSNVNINFEEFMNNIRYFYNNKKHTKLFVKIMDVSIGDNEAEFYNLFRNCSDRMYVEKMNPAYDGVELTKGMEVKYDRYGRELEKRKVCPLPFFTLTVFPNGDVQPCCTIYKPIKLGNIDSDELTSIWNGEKLRDFYIMQLKGNRCSNKRCAKCSAPDDVSQQEDVLDNDAERILRLLKY